MPAVCILTETYHPVTGGGETQARALLNGLAGAGFRVRLVTRRTDRDLPRREPAGDALLRRVGPAGHGRLRKWGLVFTAFWALARMRREYDVILVCGFRILGIPAAVAGLIWKKRLVLKADSQGELSGAFFDPGLARIGLRHDRAPVRFLLRLRNVLLRRADAFVAISAVIEREYRACGIEPGRIARIPNSVDIHHFRPATPEERASQRRRLSLAPGQPVAVFTGRLVTTKGLPLLLQAWREVLGKRPDAILMVVGSGGLGLQNCEQQLRDYVADHGIGPNVRFVGEAEDVRPYLQASDLFVFPSRREAFGISVIEAMACGLPVVTTRIEGIADVIRPGVDALAVAPDDARALAAALLRVLEGGPGITAMGEAARASALERFSQEEVVSSYRDLLLHGIGESGS